MSSSMGRAEAKKTPRSAYVHYGNQIQSYCSWWCYAWCVTSWPLPTDTRLVVMETGSQIVSEQQR